jgi:hypothetical protein
MESGFETTISLLSTKPATVSQTRTGVVRADNIGPADVMASDA